MAAALPGPVSASYGPDVWRGHQAQRDIPTLPSGHEKLDRHLPGKGWPLGALTELLTGTAGSGEFSLLLPTLAAIGSQRGWVMLVDPPWVPYPPAMHGHGLALDRLMLIRTRTQKESLWACEQALRGVRGGAILAWQDDPGFARLRRLQLAAKAGHKAAFLFRPINASNQASPAALRLQIHAQETGVQVSILKCRGQRSMEKILVKRPWQLPGQEEGSGIMAHRPHDLRLPSSLPGSHGPDIRTVHGPDDLNPPSGRIRPKPASDSACSRLALTPEPSTHPKITDEP